MNKKLFLSLSLFTVVLSVQARNKPYENDSYYVELPLIDFPVMYKVWIKPYLFQRSKVEPVVTNQPVEQSVETQTAQVDVCSVQTQDVTPLASVLVKTEYNNAGKFAVTAAVAAVAIGLSYKYGVFGKIKSAAQSMYAKVAEYCKPSRR